jgi:outer membrane protein OmpA-like peptidoglycan-associated protein
VADINVEPKRHVAIILWLLAGISFIAVLFFLTHRLNEQGLDTTATTSTAITSKAGFATNANWNNVDINAPAVNYNEITNSDIIVRGINDYTIYSIKEEVLFETGKSTIRADAINDLQQIANSIEQRFTNGLVRIYERWNDSSNKASPTQLTLQRVETVRNWLFQNGNIAAKNITINPIGKVQTGSSIQTLEGQQQNYRIDIVARRPS